ncbi:hypothetical protein QWY31_08180, partial [Cytophagales bacterium LB-30]
MKRIVFILIFGLWCLDTLGQEFQAFSPIHEKVIPPSPDVAAMAKVHDIPMNYNTGSPNIAFPLLELKTYGYSLPVSINYNSTGNRVDDIASRVGLGWSLEMGGTISRVTKGKPDESANGYFNEYPYWLQNIKNSSITQFPAWEDPVYQYLGRIVYGEYDLQPDVFSFHFPGYSGKIIFNPETMEPVFFPYEEIMVLSHPFQSGVDEWRFKTPDGIIYVFGVNGVEFTQDNYNQNYPSAWHLTQITTPVGGAINFLYEDEASSTNEGVIVDQVTTHMYSKYAPFDDPCYTPNFPSTLSDLAIYYKKRLVKIMNNQNDFISISYDDDRSDLLTGVTPSRLDKISELRLDLSNSQKDKIVNFTYGYIGDCSQPGKCRLVLSSILKNWESKSTDFAYNDLEVPDYRSFGKDHWGYYNSFNSNTNLVPALPSMYNSDYGASMSNANRNTVPSSSLFGMISSITYPTGGKQIFEFESHKIDGNVGVDFPNNLEWNVYSAIAFGDSQLHGPMSILENDIKNQILNDDYQLTGIPNIRASRITLLQSSQAKLNFSVTDINGGPIPPQGFPTTARLYAYPINDIDTYIEIGATITLVPPGDYVLVSMASQVSSNIKVTANLSVLEPVSTNIESFVGGARVKKITTLDIDGTETSTKEFMYRRDVISVLNGPILGNEYNFSGLDNSGVLFKNPSYFKMNLCDNIMMSAYNTNEYGRYDGYHIGYDEVTVITSGLTNGISIYKYLNSLNTYTRGQLKEEIHYRYEGTITPRYRLVQKKINKYSTSEGDYYFVKSVPEVKIEVVNVEKLCFGFQLCGYIYYYSEDIPSYYTSFWHHLSETTIEDYSYTSTQTNTISRTKNFFHEKAEEQEHTGLTLVIESGPNGEKIGTSIKYLRDVEQNPVNLNNISLEKRFIIRNNTSYLKKARKIEYDIDGHLPIATYIFETTNEVQDTEEIPSNMFSVDQQFTVYGDKGSLREYISRDGVINTLIHQLDNQGVMAHVINASASSTAFTNFESSDKGQFTYTGATATSYYRTGARSYYSTSPISKGQLPEGTYTVSAWARTGSGSGTVTVNGSSKSV